MPSRAQYYRRQADICMRLSLLSDDDDVAELLVSKALELMSQAESAAAEDPMTVTVGSPSDHPIQPDEPR
jgi:hypothetical protein